MYSASSTDVMTSFVRYRVKPNWAKTSEQDYTIIRTKKPVYCLINGSQYSTFVHDCVFYTLFPQPISYTLFTVFLELNINRIKAAWQHCCSTGMHQYFLVQPNRAISHPYSNPQSAM
jgi:hypothetical protein